MTETSEIRGIDALVGHFVYVTRQPEAALDWVRKSQFPFDVTIIPPDHNRVGLGALELLGWQFIFCSDADIQEAVDRSLPAYLDSRMRVMRR